MRGDRVAVAGLDGDVLWLHVVDRCDLSGGWLLLRCILLDHPEQPAPDVPPEVRVLHRRHILTVDRPN